MRNTFWIVLFVFCLTACNRKDKQKVDSKEYESHFSDSISPPSPPPFPFERIATEKLSFHYGNANINFQVSLFSNRLFNLNGQDLQTFSLYAKNDYQTDSFYFALPIEMNRFWQEVSILKKETEFSIGYYNDKKEFKSLYAIYMGDFKLNRNRIFLKYIDTLK